MNNSLIISGEASETDSEDEGAPPLQVTMWRQCLLKLTHICLLQLDMSKSIQGAVVLGEDSESDTDNGNDTQPPPKHCYFKIHITDNASIASAVSALQLVGPDTSNGNIDHDSLFQQRLRDLNTTLHNNIESLLQTSADEAERNVSNLEHQLLKSQITLQGAVSSLKSLSINSLTLKNKLHSILSSKFLPNISCSQVSSRSTD